MASPSFSDQLRQAIDNSGLSRYAICKQIVIDQSTMSKFMNHKGGMSSDALDRLGELLGLRVVADKKEG